MSENRRKPTIAELEAILNGPEPIITILPDGEVIVEDGDKKRIAELERKLSTLKQLVSVQAEDDGLWFIAQTASEGYLQQELRKLHAAIEEE